VSVALVIQHAMRTRCVIQGDSKRWTQFRKSIFQN